jgi:hypothetical protein
MVKNVKPSLKIIEGRFRRQKIGYLKLIVKPANWPAWSPNKGKSAAVFIDEIFLN